MSTIVLRQAWLGFVHLIATGLVVDWVGSPMSWSPDSRWLSYTMAPEVPATGRQPAGLFDATPGEPAEPKAAAPAEDRRVLPAAPTGPGAYRIWASQRDGAASAAIEESAWPLSSPRWSPRGRAMAFCRFVPAAIAPAGQAPRGRLEVVVADGLDRKRTLLAIPDFELDDETCDRMPHSAPAWSPDGQYLAVPRPGRSPAVLIVRVDARRVLRTLDGAMLPAWSPDGSKLVYVRRDEQGEHTLWLLERQGTAMSAPRDLQQPIGHVVTAPGWGADGRSILAIIARNRPRSPVVDLVRISAESGEAMRIFSPVPEATARMTTVRGIAIDYDRNEDACFFSVDLEGRETDLCWSIPREQTQYRRFPPLDPSMRIGSLAVAPDGRAVAMRFGTPESLSPPAVCELEVDRMPPTERTTLIVADDAARRAWRDLLARTARSLLAIAMPPIVVEGKPVSRAAWLPLPDEIPSALPVKSRFARLGRFGASVCTTVPRPVSAGATPADDAEAELDLEDRLFFDYLKGDYAAATADLEGLEARPQSHRRRLELLGLRAQILWAQGDAERARDVADFLLEAVGGATYRLDETPIGRTLVPESGTGREWARHLASRAAQPRPPTTMASDPRPLDRDDALFLNPFGPPGFDLQLHREPGPGDLMPNGLNVPEAQREMIRALRLQIEQRLQEDARLRPAAPPGPIDVIPR